MAVVRAPAVAGAFYPADPAELGPLITSLLGAAKLTEGRPKALIVPHAGYIYSGPVAASAYAQLRAAGEPISRVVLVGPSHRAAFAGLAASGADAFATPLGTVPVDQDAVRKVLCCPHVRVWDAAHTHEHCLEVHLPFLQHVLDQFHIVPLLVGEASAVEVAEPIEAVWGGPETVILVSSDLSHYHDYETARKLDEATTRAIERLEDVEPEQACGYRAICGLLHLARKRAMTVRTLDLRNSGDTAGPRDQVVGYGAYAFQ